MYFFKANAKMRKNMPIQDSLVGGFNSPENLCWGPS